MKVVVIILGLVVIRVWVKAAMAWSYGDCMHSFFSSKVDLQPMRCRGRLRSLWSCSKFWSPESWQIPISRIASQVARVFRGGSNFGWYIKMSLIMILVLLHSYHQRDRCWVKPQREGPPRNCNHCRGLLSSRLSPGCSTPNHNHSSLTPSDKREKKRGNFWLFSMTTWTPVSNKTGNRPSSSRSVCFMFAASGFLWCCWLLSLL